MKTKTKKNTDNKHKIKIDNATSNNVRQVNKSKGKRSNIKMRNKKKTVKRLQVANAVKQSKSPVKRRSPRKQVNDGSDDESNASAKETTVNINITSLKKMLNNSLQKTEAQMSLRERMQERLKAARFRYLNEQMYTSQGKDAQRLFQSDPDSFGAYHDGYKQQVSRWPLNPLDVIIDALGQLPTALVVADFGCGEARLARSVPQATVHSFDLVAAADGVVACDMAHCLLARDTVDVAVFCLSLMGTNLNDFLAEANRVLKIGGILKIAEVESRFEQVEVFIQQLQKYGFSLAWKDLSCNLFYFLDFKKEQNIQNKNKLPVISLHPCLYKKR